MFCGEGRTDTENSERHWWKWIQKRLAVRPNLTIVPFRMLTPTPDAHRILPNACIPTHMFIVSWSGRLALPLFILFALSDSASISFLQFVTSLDTLPIVS